MKTLTEAQAWQKIADDIERARRMPQGLGLCREAYELSVLGEISRGLYDDMCDRIRLDLDVVGDGSFAYTGFLGGQLYESASKTEWWAPRLMLAQIYALEAAEEARRS